MDFLLHLGAEFLGHDGGGVVVHHLADAGHHAQAHQLLDHVAGGLLQTAGQFTHGDLVGDLHLQLGLAGLFQLDALQALGLGLPALLEGLTAPVLVVGELLLVAGGGGLAAVLHVLGARQLGVPLVELIQVHVHGTGVHHLGHDLPLGGLYRLGGLGLALGLGLLLFLLLMARGGHLHHGAVGLLQDLALLGLRLRGGIQVGVQAGLLGLLGEMLKNVVQLGLVQVGSGLLRLAAPGSQQVDDLLGRLVQVFGYFAYFIFDNH